MLLSSENVLLVMSITLFSIGMLFMFAGLWKLMARDLSVSAKILAVQSARLGKKALTEDITGLVESATRLSDSVNTLIRTSAGVGVSLVVLGALSMAAGYYILPVS